MQVPSRGRSKFRGEAVDVSGLPLPTIDAQVDDALHEAHQHGQIARVFVDLLAARFALLPQVFERLIDAAQELQNDRGRDVGHDAQAEDRDSPQVGGAEHRHALHQAEERAGLVALHARSAICYLIDDRQRNLIADPEDGQQDQA